MSRIAFVSESQPEEMSIKIIKAFVLSSLRTRHSRPLSLDGCFTGYQPMDLVEDGLLFTLFMSVYISDFPLSESKILISLRPNVEILVK